MRCSSLTLAAPIRAPWRPAELLAAAARWRQRFEQRRRRRRQLDELRRVPPHILKDIGIDRSELMSVVYGDTAGRVRRHADG